MRRSALSAWTSRLILAALALAVLAAAASPQTAKPKPGAAKPQLPLVRYGAEGLPRPALELRETMLAAIEAGNIEELRQAYDLSEPKPDLGAAPGTDPVAHWKAVSADGQGREVLAALSLILQAGHVALPLGRDLENNQLYVWPYFAEWPLGRLTPKQEVELLRLVPAGVARDMKEKGKYTHWRLVIGADGTWHSFRKGD